MILTDEKIKVTDRMMHSSGLMRLNPRGASLGVPDGSGVVWKSLSNMTDSDFDKIESYFLKKEQK